MVSEALSCILHFKKFSGGGPPYPPPQKKRGAHPPLVLCPPRVFDARAHAVGMSNFPNFNGTGTFPIWWIKSLYKWDNYIQNVHLQKYNPLYGCKFSFTVTYLVIFFEKSFQEYYPNVKQFGTRSGPTYCLVCFDALHPGQQFF